MCFDEHRAFGVESFTRGEGVYARSRVWAAARDVAAAAPVAPVAPRQERSAWWWLGVAALAGAAGWGLAQGIQRIVRRGRRAVAAVAAVEPPKVRRLPQINTATCIGCHACVDACPYDVIDMRNFVARVVRPDDCCGLTLCEQRCPNGSLVVLEGERVPDLPALDERLASRVAPGIFLAGDITGLPLIRNAINQGAHAVQAIADELRARGRSRSELELVIVGAGPAGISAALEAKRLGLRYLVLEQASAAESIRSFPRGKLVFD